ncbi:MAG: hypothetical protein BMS9Abin05_1955 [Rhodothermia bacterium]|nr:MAG: hypothetical protein BMS9Abin05_1955 [Rhodothermia bacterium]
MAIENEAGEPVIQPPAQQNMFEGSNGSNEGQSDQQKQGSSRPRGTASLQRLKDRIGLAVKELSRLREENASLHKQIDSLRTDGIASVEGTSVVFTESSEALRSQVEKYIEAIDRSIDLVKHSDSNASPSDQGSD